MLKPTVGITVDNRDNSAASGQYSSAIHYSRAVRRAGGLPLLLPHAPELADAYASLCHALVLTGGGDPTTEPFGEPTHPQARRIDPDRQAFELALLDAAIRHARPTLGVCLGMQLMALHAGGRLHQFLPEVIDDPEHHQDCRTHTVRFDATDAALAPDDGPVVSSHRQAVRDPGSMRIVARADDGVIEAIDQPDAPCGFFLGVQWHPERGDDGPLNLGLFTALTSAARRSTSTPIPPAPPRSTPRRPG